MREEKETGTVKLGIKSAKVASLAAMTSVLSIVIGGLMVIVLARLLQPAEYGIYTLATGVSTFFSAFGLLGIDNYLNRSIPIWSARNKRDELRKDLGTSMLVLFAASLAAVLVGVACSGFISTYVFHSPNYVPVIDVALVSTIFMLLMFLEASALIGFKDGIGSAITFSGGTIAIAFASIALVLLGYGVFGAISGMVVGSAFGVAIGVFFINKRSRIEFKVSGFAQRAKHILLFSLPLTGASLISTLVYSFSVILLGVFSSSLILGSFGIAYNIGTMVSVAIGFVGTVLVQMFSSALESRKSRQTIGKLYNYSIYFGLMLSIPIVVYLIVFAHAFVVSLFPNFRSALLYIPAICVSFVIGSVGVYASSLAISTGKVRTVLKYAALTGIAQFALLLLLVPIINAYGVIIGVYLIGNLINDYLYVRYMKREMHITIQFGRIFKIVFASILLAVLLSPINLLQIDQRLQLAFGIVATLIIYPILLGLTRAIGKKEVDLLRMMGKSTPRMEGLFYYLASYISIFIR